MVDVLRLGGEELSEEDGGGEGNGGYGWPKLSFGCIRKQSGLFDKQVNPERGREGACLVSLHGAWRTTRSLLVVGGEFLCLVVLWCC